jgi:hypothetical protein
VDRCILKASIFAKYRHSEQDLQNSEHLHYSHLLWLACSSCRSCSFYLMSGWPWFLLSEYILYQFTRKCSLCFFNILEPLHSVFLYLYKDMYNFWFYSTILISYFVESQCSGACMRVHIVVIYLPNLDQLELAFCTSVFYKEIDHVMCVCAQACACACAHTFACMAPTNTFWIPVA